jgi:hypothetical protein
LGDRKVESWEVGLAVEMKGGTKGGSKQCVREMKERCEERYVVREGGGEGWRRTDEGRRGKHGEVREGAMRRAGEIRRMIRSEKVRQMAGGRLVE